MSLDHSVDLAREALLMVLLLCGPPLLAALAVGLLVSLLQAMTQLQDVTIGFVPRLLAVLVVLAFLWPWMGEQLIDYSTALYRDLPRSLSP
jgi:flagellar biosynthesis protein FliQ